MNLEFWLLAAVLFIPIAGISFIALRRAWLPRERVQELIRRPAPELVHDSSSDLLFEGITYPLASMLPTTKNGRAVLFQELRAAGYYSAGALTSYLALRNVLIVLPLLVAGILALIFEPADFPLIAIVGVIVAALGFSLPRLYIQTRGRARARQIERGLPTAIDLLVLALTAGLNLFAALQRVAGELRPNFPALAEELDITRRQAELRSLEFALEQLADRVRLPDVRNLALVLAQSERLGSDATPVLLETSTALRTTLRQRAETQANRVSFWLLIPTVACFLVAALLVLVGPVFIEFRDLIAQNQTKLQQGQQDIGRFGRAPVPARPGAAAGQNPARP